MITTGQVYAVEPAVSTTCIERPLVHKYHIYIPLENWFSLKPVLKEPVYKDHQPIKSWCPSGYQQYSCYVRQFIAMGKPLHFELAGSRVKPMGKWAFSSGRVYLLVSLVDIHIEVSHDKGNGNGWRSWDPCQAVNDDASVRWPNLVWKNKKQNRNEKKWLIIQL